MSARARTVAGAVLVLGVLAAGAWFAWQRLLRAPTPHEVAVQLQQTAAAMNRELPAMIDPATRLDATAGIGSEFHYNYTLLEAKDTTARSQLDARLRPHLKQMVCSSEEMREFMKPGVTAVYNYRDPGGALLASIRVRLSDCY